MSHKYLINREVLNDVIEEVIDDVLLQEHREALDLGINTKVSEQIDAVFSVIRKETFVELEAIIKVELIKQLLTKTLTRFNKHVWRAISDILFSKYEQYYKERAGTS